MEIKEERIKKVEEEKEKVKTIRAVFFDLWDTLVYSYLKEISHEIIDRLNLRGKREFWYGWETVSTKPIEKMDEVIMSFCKAVRRENSFNLVKKILEDLERKTIVFEDVRPTLEFLKKKGLKLGLITNTDKPSFLLARKKLKLEEFFEIIITSFETGLLKPNPEIFSLAVRKLGFNFKECVMVGDNLADDIFIPHKLGMLTVLVDRKNIFGKKPEDTDYLIDNLLELRNLIR